MVNKKQESVYFLFTSFFLYIAALTLISIKNDDVDLFLSNLIVLFLFFLIFLLSDFLIKITTRKITNKTTLIALAVFYNVLLIIINPLLTIAFLIAYLKEKDE
ncbi:MAG: hypothetical protein ABGW69_02530 [Nanoarchaeota archaeon]